MSHEPVYLNINMPYINIHGHLHSKKMEGIQFVNVSVENWNYTPIDIKTIIQGKG
jgi:calcineurin-like phosphoesterase family protein